LIVCPTGGGKTIVGGEIIRGRTAARKRTVFVAHRDELLTQAHDKLQAFGIDAGIIKAGRDKDMRRHSFRSAESKPCMRGPSAAIGWNCHQPNMSGSTNAIARGR
jgi:type I site-specific restriction endonuclease